MRVTNDDAVSPCDAAEQLAGAQHQPNAELKQLRRSEHQFSQYFQFPRSQTS